MAQLMPLRRVRIPADRLSFHAGMGELVDPPSSEGGAARRVGSTPTIRTSFARVMELVVLLGRELSAERRVGSTPTMRTKR